MNGPNGQIVQLCSELEIGDAIEARYAGKLHHRGPVTDVLPEMGLFWIIDALTGGRKLLCISELEVSRLNGPARPVQGHITNGLQE